MVMVEAPIADNFDVNKRLGELTKGKTALAEMRKLIPHVYAELAQMMLDETDLRSRERCKRMMRGLLEFIAADTKYPAKQEEIKKNENEL
jgi:hypothetical protein